MGLARGASEVLLLRHLKNRGAKTVYIPPNRNGNPRGTATVTFKNKEDLRSASRNPVRYNNYILYWKLLEETKVEDTEDQEKYKKEHRRHMVNNKKEAEKILNVKKEEEPKEKENSSRGKKRNDKGEDKNELSTEEILYQILDRLNNLEGKVCKTGTPARSILADRS